MGNTGHNKQRKSLNFLAVLQKSNCWIMSFNEFMHPRNMYRTAPDFKALGEKYPEFKEYVLSQKNGKYRIDFKDPAALRVLTKVLLKNDFNIDIEIPENSIIPTVPQRLNYILWMEDLLAKLPNAVTVKGIDIGTGPCCIFSLLGHKKNGWHFIATEIDEESIKWGEKNIKKNNLQDFIAIVKVPKGAILRGVLEHCHDTVDFCLCNPPFFEDFEDQRKKKLPHFSKLPEIIVDGGEVAFVKKIIDDSLHFKEKIRIYSSMLGKKKSLKEITDVLKQIEGVKYTTTNFCQGNTVRWGVAWTFLPIPDFNTESPKKKKNEKKDKRKKPLSFKIFDANVPIRDMVTKVTSVLDNFQISYQEMYVSKTKAHLQVKAFQNTWTGQRRKRRELERKLKGIPLDTKDDNQHPDKVTSKSENEYGDEEFLMAITDDTGSQKRKAEYGDEPDTPHKRLKVDTEEDKSESTVSNAAKNEVDICSFPVLNCNINLIKIDDHFIFQMSCISDSSTDTMYQVFQQFRNKLLISAKNKM